MMNKESDGMGCHWDRAGLMVGYQYSKDFVVSAVYRHFWKKVASLDIRKTEDKKN